MATAAAEAVAAAAGAVMAVLARTAAKPISDHQEADVQQSVAVLKAFMEADVGCDWMIWQCKVCGVCL